MISEELRGALCNSPEIKAGSEGGHMPAFPKVWSRQKEGGFARRARRWERRLRGQGGLVRREQARPPEGMRSPECLEEF